MPQNKLDERKHDLPDGPASRITWELFQGLSYNIYECLKDSSDIVEELFEARVRERWAYGFVSRALSRVLDADRKNENNFILTEIPFSRNKGTGRIDFVFSYRKCLFMMEFKSSGCGLSRAIDDTGRLGRQWSDPETRMGCTDQLHSVFECKNEHLTDKNNDERLTRFAERRKLNHIVPLPVLLCSYTKLSKDQTKLEKACQIADKDIIERHAEIKKKVLKTSRMSAVYKTGQVPHEAKSGGYRLTLAYGFFAGDTSLDVFWNNLAE